MSITFDSFNFSPSIARTLKDLGYTKPTPIQAKAIQPILDGRDLLGLAQTGTGKTAAFTLPILQYLGEEKNSRKGKRRVRGLIISPTRELAEQTNDYLEKFTRPLGLKSGVAYGGVSRSAQANRLKAGVDILVACPGRLLDLASDRSVDLRGVRTLVLDEADQMFDRGFLPDIHRIIGKLPAERQNLVFSATMPKEVHKLIDEVLDTPMVVEIEHKKALKSIHHSFYGVSQSHKTALLKSLLVGASLDSTIIFTRTKMKAKRLAEQLGKAGYAATSLQGNLSQGQRQRALDGFKKGTFKILVATDIASRGIDVENLGLVINYDMPESEEVYTHRTGRTGRAGRSGEAWTFAVEKDDRLVKNLTRRLGGQVEFTRPEPASYREFLVLDGLGKEKPRQRKERSEGQSGRPQRRDGAGSGGRRRASGRPVPTHSAAPAGEEREKKAHTSGKRRARRHRGKRAAQHNREEVLYSPA